jgi:2-hydroxychromene-2-carboxylate isomerase
VSTPAASRTSRTNWKASPAAAAHERDRQDPAKAIAFAKAAYRKYWLRGCATSDATVAIDAAASVGYEQEMVIAGMQEQTTKDRLALENEEAIHRGVFGSPFFIVDGEPFWGSDRISLIAGEARREAELMACPERGY